jgi:hypothetical protein
MGLLSSRHRWLLVFGAIYLRRRYTLRPCHFGPPLRLVKGTTRFQDGWHEVTSRTRLFIRNGKPRKVEITAYDLDAAFDAAAQFYGEPLERLGRWTTDEGLDPEVGGVGDHERVTCQVMTAADYHEDEPSGPRRSSP